ncbi:hypothetical protein AVEN_37857-1 [Araneus ventricosus]|uniref:Uncharacterized protein n=1 Tax=Araneus ventricosus TaxID=182803 RepID=A0A4Y2H6K5_ARAVE|nr:hypothetical protein AVEN_37857-1 [Araneus ventricosus]
MSVLQVGPAVAHLSVDTKVPGSNPDLDEFEVFCHKSHRASLVGVNKGTLSMPIDETAETPKCSPGTSNTVSPFDLSPVPNIKKRTTTRGRKATRSSLITGSPYKDQLTKSLEESAPKKT